MKREQHNLMPAEANNTNNHLRRSSDIIMRQKMK